MVSKDQWVCQDGDSEVNYRRGCPDDRWEVRKQKLPFQLKMTNLQLQLCADLLWTGHSEETKKYRTQRKSSCYLWHL